MKRPAMSTPHMPRVEAGEADLNRDLKELRYETAEKSVAAAEKGVGLAKDRAERIIREARHLAYLAYCERNAAMKALGIHPDQIAEKGRRHDDA